MSKEFTRLLENYPVEVRELASETSEFIKAAVPEALEMVDDSARVIGYGFGPGYADLICTIILSKRGVKLGISRSAELPDPNGLLEGAGKVHRYVALNETSDLGNPGLKQLLEAAVAAWNKRSGTVA